MRARWIYLLSSLFALALLSGAGQEKAAVPLPSVPQILERYIAALGGRAAIEHLTSRVAHGRLLTPAGEAPLEIYVKAPDKFFRQIDSPAGGISRNAFDGTTAWSANRNAVREMTGPEVESFKREYNLYREIRLAEFYPGMALQGKQSLDGNEVYVLTGSPAEGTPEKFYFDARSGLLLRWDVTLRGTTLESHYEDYRAVDSVKVAFRIRRVRSDGFGWADQFDELRHNVAIDDAKFTRPAAPAQTPPAQGAPAPGQAPASPKSPIPDTFTNLQVLPGDIAKNQLVAIMKAFSFTTGQRCSFCHVATDDLSEADFPADEKEQKKKARELLRMILDTGKGRQ